MSSSVLLLSFALVASAASAACVVKNGDPSPVADDESTAQKAVDLDLGACSRGFCSQTCPAGRSCTATCSGGGCAQVCESNASCTFSCSGGGCARTCAAGASCDLTCSGGGCR